VQGAGIERRLVVPKPIAFAIRSMIEPAALVAAELRTWRILAEWAYELSRKQTGPNVFRAFSLVASELENLKRGLTWAIESAPDLAAYLVVATWRTICARGHPSLDGDLLFRAAEAGASLLEPILGGEAWTGAAITLSMSGQFELAEHAYREATRIFKSAGHDSSAAWAQLNYAVCVLVFTDKLRAIETIKVVVEEAVEPGLRMLAKTDYALMLASTGVIAEPIQVAEEIFATRLQSNDLTMQARAYVDLGELYQVAGRTEAARPLIAEGIRRLRDAGIQYMLLDQLIFLGQILVSEDEPDWAQIREIVKEANQIGNRMGAMRKMLKVARIELEYASRAANRSYFLQAIEETFQLTQSSQSSIERERSLRILAEELKRHQKAEYSSAICAALGDEVEGPTHKGWTSLLATDSHDTICVLAVVMAKEALAAIPASKLDNSPSSSA